MAMMGLGIDFMLPAFDEIEAEFGLEAGSGQISQIITVYFFGLAFAQLVYGPLADAWGRKRVLYLAVGIYIVGAVLSALATSFALLLAGRFVWGIGAAGARVVAAAIIRDRFEGVAMAKAMSQIMAVFVLVPVFAPALGAGMMLFVEWRMLFWFCAVCAVGVALWSLRLDETMNPADRRDLNIGNTLRGYTQVARTPVTFGYTMSALFLQGVFTAYLSASESIVDEVFGRGDQFPLIFGAVAILFGLASLINGRIVERLGMEGVLIRAYGVIIPLSLLLVLVAVLSDGEPSIWIYMPVLGLTLGPFMLLMPNLGAAAMVPLGAIAGSASAFTGAVRTAGGALLATLVAGWVEADTVAFAIWVSACCTASAGCMWLVQVRSAGRAAAAA